MHGHEPGASELSDLAWTREDMQALVAGSPSETLTNTELPEATTSLRVAHNWASAHALPEFSI